MSDLDPSRCEALARALAGGKNRRAARAAAGLAPGGFEGAEHTATFKTRVSELQLRREALGAAGLEDTVLAMLQLAVTADPATAAVRREARAARLEALRLNEQLRESREAEAYVPPRPMTTAEWLAEFAPKSSGG